MLKIRATAFLIFIFSLCLSQGRMNGFGIGHYYHWQGTGNAIDGLSNINPAFQSHVSLSNPSTWHNLEYSFLSISYSGSESIFKRTEVSNGYSSLSNAAWIVPYKKKISFGVVLSPYSDQRIELIDSVETPFTAFDNEYNYLKSFKRNGGVLSLKLGTSYKINDKIDFGFFHHILFGSSRQNESIFFDGSSIVQSTIAKYDGITQDVFISVSIFKDLQIFSKYSYTIRPLRGVFEQRNLFDDANGNGYHDYLSPSLDFPIPYPDSTNKFFNIDNLHRPSGFILGINKNFKSELALSIDVGIHRDNTEISNDIRLPINNKLKNTNSLKFTLLRYPNKLSLDIFDKFSFKAGFVYHEHLLMKNNYKINELGYSFGIGFRFKPIGNQIDLNYYFGNRLYDDIIEKETIQQLQLGISLADIWFVKRRQR